MLTKKDKTKLAGFYNYHAEKEKEEPYEIEWDQEEYETTIDMLETHNKYLYEKLQKADERIDKAIEYIEKFEDIKAYYSYEENGYEEYNYDEDFKKDLLDILRGKYNE